MMPPEISVVVPSFNRAALLPETLDAILGQSVAPLEVIVVDDGSSDGTAAMLAARYAGRLRVLHIENSGDLAARNAGLREARGRLIAWCDSDDIWQPGYLAAMTALWRAEPRACAAFADFTILRDGRHETRRKFDTAPHGFWHGLRHLPEAGLGVFDTPVVARLIGFQPIFPSCLVTSRAFMLGLGGWDETVGRIVGSDFATILRIGEYAPLGVVRRPLVAIRKHAGNHSADTEAMNLGDAAILEHALARRASLAGLAPQILRSVARRRADALALAFARHDYAAVRRIFAMLPGAGCGWAVRVKAWVSKTPGPLRDTAARMLLALGTIRARAQP